MDADRDRIDDIFGAWYERRERGESADVEDLVADHPDIAVELRARGAALDLLDEALGEPARLAPPARIGPYELLEPLGAGGMGTVHRARVRGGDGAAPEGTFVALKILHPHLLARPGFFKRFLREAQIGRCVDHPGVVRTLDADAVNEDGRTFHFLVMEYVEGRTLRDLLDEVGRVPEALCRHIALATCRGLAAIHAAGAVHRDLKPENVLITDDEQVKVMDLGVARLGDESARLSRSGVFVGSFHYAAPEQFAGGAVVDHRADLHALGVMLYELSSGTHPYHDADLRVALRRLLDEEPRRVAAVNPQLSPFFEELVHTLMAKDRDRRFAAACDVAQALSEGEESDWWRDRARTLRRETGRGLRRVRIPRETVLHGRDDDLSALAALWRDAHAGHGRVVLLQGEAGIGKTRLVDEFVGRLREGGEDVEFLFGEHPPGGAATAAGAIATAFCEHFGHEGLEDSLRHCVTATPSLVPAFAALLLGRGTPQAAEPLTPDSLKTVVVHATRALAARRPIVLLVDDLHNAPAEGRALFAALALGVRDHRVLLIGTARPGLPEAWLAALDREPHVTRRTLSRLGPKELMRLLEDTFRSERLAQELGHQIAVKSDGNPYFVFEIVRGLREGRLITQTMDGSWISTRTIRRIAVPSSVTDLVRGRIAGLSGEELHLLEVAACAGFTFDGRLVADALRIGRVPALQILGRIERTTGLVRACGRSFVFDHHQIQEALYEDVSVPLREEYHAAIARVLRSQPPGEDPGARAVDLCRHLFAGGLAERALPVLPAALDRLDQLHEAERALHLLDPALAAADRVRGAARVDLLLRRAAYLDLLGRPEEELGTLEEARALAEVHGEATLHARALCRLGSLRGRVGDGAAATDAYERALGFARRVGDATVAAAAEGGLGNVLLDLGRYDESLDRFRNSIDAYREAGDPRGEASATGNLALVLTEQGRLEEARACHESALAICRAVGYRRGEGNALGNLGNVLTAQGRIDDALSHYGQQLAVYDRIGDRRGQALATGNLGSALASRGDTAAALSHLERQRLLADEVGHHRGRAVALFNLAETYTLLGRGDHARERLDDAAELAGRTGFRLVEFHVSWVRARLAGQEDDRTTAERWFAEAVVGLRRIGARPALAGALVEWGGLLLRAGTADHPLRSLAEGVEIARETRAPGPLVLGTLLLAEAGHGEATAARALLATHAPLLDLRQRMTARWIAWRLCGEPDDLAEATGLLDRLRDNAPPDCRTSVERDVPLHREIEAARGRDLR